jgi:hypothetical protein
MIAMGGSMALTVRNTIAQGVAADVATTATSGQAGTLAIDHSAYDSVSGAGITTGSGNVTAEPIFVDAAAADFHQAAGSPTIDKGVLTAGDTKMGTSDFDGQARTQGDAPDIGADERAPDPKVEPTPAPVVETPAPVVDAPVVDKTAPLLTAFRLTPSAFGGAKSGGSTIAAVGARVGYTLSEPALVLFSVERKSMGVKKGKKCVKPRKKKPAKRGKTCARYTGLAGTFTHAGKAGANTFGFTGRLAGLRLALGAYRLVAVATDLSGNSSKAARAAFKVTKK